MAAEKDLPTIFHEWLSTTMEENGFELAHGFGLDADGGLTVYALALPIPDAYRLMITTWASQKHQELIFGFDRYTKPGQGTTLGDLVAGWHCTPAGPEPFIVEYQFAPRKLMPFDWSNAHWNAALRGELLGPLRAVSGVSL